MKDASIIYKIIKKIIKKINIYNRKPKIQRNLQFPIYKKTRPLYVNKSHAQNPAIFSTKVGISG